MKTLLIVLTIFLITACSSTPQPKKARGAWVDLNTTAEAVKADTF